MEPVNNLEISIPAILNYVTEDERSRIKKRLMEYFNYQSLGIYSEPPVKGQEFLLEEGYYKYHLKINELTAIYYLNTEMKQIDLKLLLLAVKS
jgi:hypothetical protein